jgi:hypothetical protein
MPMPVLETMNKNCKSFCHHAFHEAINLNPLGQEHWGKKYHYIHPEGLVNHFQIVMLTDVNVNIDITSQFSFNVQ